MASNSKKGFGVIVDAQEFIKNTNKHAQLNSKELLSVFNRSLSRSSVQTIVKEARRDLKRHLSFSEESSGETVKSLGVKSAKRKPIVLVGARISGNHNGQLVHILDQGTKQRISKGKNRGRVLGLDFYMAAMKSKNGELEQKFNRFLKEYYLKRIIKKI